MGTMLLVRHASTDASQEGRNLGQSSDPPLSAVGTSLAERLGALLASELSSLAPSMLRLLTSPARRCRETTRAILPSLPGNPDVEVLPALLEINYGEWEGLTADECAVRDPTLRSAWEADPYATPTPGGESGADVGARAFPVLRQVEAWLTDDPARCAVVVAHNHVNRLWLTAVAGWPMADYRRRLSQDPAGCSIIRFDGGTPLLRRLNAIPAG